MRGGGTDLATIFSKAAFKQACVDAGIEVARTFPLGAKVKFPVIVKPTDNGGSRGITICNTQSELDSAITKAMSFSDKGEVLIEEYLACDEIMVYFTVHNGIATLSAMCDCYTHNFKSDIAQIPTGFYYPSKYLDMFIEYNLEKFRQLIHNLGIRDGLIAFQSFVRGNDVMPFDPTYRLDGTVAYHMIERVNGVNVLQMLIHKSLAGTMGDDAEICRLENPHFSSPAYELAILLGKGTITKMEGFDEVQSMPDVVDVSMRHKVGEVMEHTAAFSQTLCRISICASNDHELLDDIEKIFSCVKVLDEHGQDMIIGRNINLGWLRGQRTD